MIFVVKGATAQKITAKTPVFSLVISNKSQYTAGAHSFALLRWDTVSSLYSTAFYKSPLTFSIISPAYYAQHWGFFCKQEWQLEKFTGLPFKFRLGSVQQCDKMEGKPNSSY
ncbi:MAG: hypothetical protein JST86_02045 [Bacteroidetes bacterium]|nr:hypothetical protein [Bacteroidota bacterium]